MRKVFEIGRLANNIRVVQRSIPIASQGQRRSAPKSMENANVALYTG
jgi:hypothetical protein